MAEQIGIKLGLSGAAQVQGGLKGVADALGQIDQRTLKVGDAFRALGPSIAAALSIGTVTAWVRTAVDATEQAGRLAQQVGIAVDELGGLELAFRRTGLQADQMAPLLSKLSLAVAQGNKALDAMGISTRNADGSLRDTMAVLRDVANAFAGYRDGASKTALAVALLGEEGTKLVPLLNRGAAGLAEFDRQARAMGLSVDRQAVEASKRFNEQIDLMQLGLAGLARTIAGPLVEALNKYIGIINRSNFRVFPAEIEAELRSLRARAATSVAEDLEAAARRNPRDTSMRREADRARAEARQRVREADEATQRLKGMVSERPADQPAAVAATRDAPTVPGGASGKDPEQQARELLRRQEAYLADLTANADRAYASMLADSRRRADENAKTERQQALQRLADTELTAEQRARAEQLIEREYNFKLQANREAQLRAQREDDKRFQNEMQKQRDDAALKDQEARDRQFRQGVELNRELRTENARLNVDLIEDDQARARARLELDRNEALDRLQNAGLDAEAEQLARTQVEDQFRLRRRILDRDDAAKAAEAAEEAARKTQEQWGRTVDQISQSLADALLSGGQSAGKALQNYFRTLILQPIIRAAVDPIARGITGALGLAGAAGPAAASGGGGGLGGIGSIFSGLSSIGSSIGFIGSGASMTMAGNGMAAFQAAGAAMSGGSIGAGAAIGLGAALPFLALGGILAAGFSRKLKDQGIQGTFGPGGFTGNEFKFYKGGFLTSDKTVLRGLPDDVRVMLSDGFNALRTGTAQMARELGLASESLDTFSKDIKLSFMGLTEEQIQQKLAQELGLVADEMARLVAGSDATADSLRQLYQAVMSERAQLEQRLLQLQGDTTELRRRERENLHETNRALFDRIVALEDEQAALEEVKRAAAEAAQALAQQIATLQGELQQAEAQRLSIAQAVVSERTALEQRLLQAQGNTAALRERELQALDPLNRAFARMVYAAEDAAQATAGAAQNLAALAGAGQGISEFVAGLRATGSGNTASLASLRATYSRTLALAQAGDVAASGRITGDARALIDAGRANARTRAEADALAARIATELAALPAAVNYERQQAESLQALLTHATQVDKAAQDSIDSNTFDTAAEGEKTVAQMRVLVSETVVNSNRLAALNTSIASLTNALTAANEAQRVQREIEALNAQGGTAVQSLASVRGNYSAAYQASAREFVDEMLRAVNPVFGALGLNPWNMRDGSYDGQQRWWDSVNAARQAGDMSRAVQLINEANLQPSGYASPVHLRFPTADAAAAGNTSYSYFGPTAAFNDTLGALNQQLAALKNTSADINTLRQRVRELGGIPAFATGGLHSGGLRLVGERGPELEVTGPARYWSAADTTAMLGNSQRRDEALVAEIRALRSQVARLEAAQVQTAVNTGKTQRLMQRVTRDGESMQVTDVTPAP